MAKIVDLMAREMALAWLQFDINFAETLEYLLETQQNVLDPSRKNSRIA